MHPCAGEPQSLTEALSSQRDYLRDAEVVVSYSMGNYPFLKGDDRLRCTALHVTPEIRELVEAGKINHVPARISDYYLLLRRGGPLQIDAMLIQVSPPDNDGNCSLGASTSIILPLLKDVPTVIAEVNRRMPRVYGPGQIPISRFRAIVESDRPLLTYTPRPPTGIEMKIGEYVAELVPDGTTLETGVGSIPSAVLRNLVHKKDLGIHSGMLTDEAANLIGSGAVTNRRKNIDTGVSVAAELMGTEILYDFAHNNPILKTKPYTYTHNPRIIARISNFAAINSAMEVDLSGQVNAEFIAGRQMSSVGGLLDFIVGAFFSDNGMSIIAMTSTAKGGKTSRIVPQIEPPSYVTVPRHMADIVVTEYGIARLRGKNLRERAEALIRIAHPAHRESLERRWKESIRT